jgi:hypothetical protein
MDNTLVGKTINAIYMNAEDTCICFEMKDGEKLYYVAEGDCCAHAYFYQHQDLDYILGSPVISVECETVEDPDAGDGDVVDIHFYVVKTMRGRATFEFRVSHNGYYSGWAKLGSADDMGQEEPKELARHWEGPRPSVWDRLEEN